MKVDGDGVIMGDGRVGKDCRGVVREVGLEERPILGCALVG